MKNLNLLLIFLLLFSAAGCRETGGTETKTEPLVVILDTDVGNDIDDVIAMEMLFNYERKGIIDIAGITIGKSNPRTIEYVDAYCRMHGRGDIPLGYAYDGVNTEDGRYTVAALDTLIDGKPILEPARTIDSNLPEGYKLLRKLLAEQEDNSVVFIAIGPLTNLGRLMDSQADEYSPLDGVELVKKKVKMLSLMAGLFNDDFDFPEWNVAQDVEAARTVFAKWPTELIASGFELGYKVLYPHQSILNDFPDPETSYRHPLTVAYKAYLPMPYDRHSWDQTSVLYAVEPDAGHFQLSPWGIIAIDQEGYSPFAEDENGLHRYLIMPDETIPSVTEAMVRATVDR